RRGTTSTRPRTGNCSAATWPPCAGRASTPACPTPRPSSGGRTPDPARPGSPPRPGAGGTPARCRAMPMHHKAFVLDHAGFLRELGEVLYRALATGDCGPLVRFIEAHRGSLTDPYEGEPLEASWESMLETRDAHQYGDFALTRFYDPRADDGLAYEWER